MAIGQPCVAFDKLDGSNIRAEWSAKRGWSKFGSRHRMIDENDWQLGHAVKLFQEQLADELSQRFLEREWKRLGVRGFVVFAEYWGPNSFAGNHDDPLEEMRLSLIDVNPIPRGFLPPREFLERFGDLDVPTVVYEGNFNRELIARVRANEFGLAEGIVAKGGTGKKLWMAKVKTADWLERLKGKYGEQALNEEFGGQLEPELV